MEAELPGKEDDETGKLAGATSQGPESKEKTVPETLT
jgi:hypothetical protein